MKQFDIVIVGGGIVGLTLACALAQRTSLTVAILDVKPLKEVWGDESYQPRVSAITLASKRIFQNLKVWDDIVAKRVSPFEEIKVWDAEDAAKIEFKAREMGEPVLGYIVENNLILSALLKKLKQAINVKIIAPIALTSFKASEDSIEITAGELSYKAKLAIAADGANSWLRAQANIDVDKEDYAQKAIVATVKTELPHEKIARQIFLNKGPLAFLPLQDAHTSSIVWSLPNDDADILKSVSSDIFKEELAQAFAHKLGKVEDVSERYIFPLYNQAATRYVANRVVLIGDAGHVVHPLAGQGVNMGLLDAASLFDVLNDAIINKRDFSHHATLRKYERWRRADNLVMFNGIKFIKNIFATPNIMIKNIRNIGMNATNRFVWIKNILMSHAVGKRKANLPSLAKA